jgi:uncharacterized membrane protein
MRGARRTIFDVSSPLAEGSEEIVVAVDVRTDIVIDLPCAEVYDYVADPTNVPAWYLNIEAVEWLTPPPAAVGSRMSFVATLLGRKLAHTYEVTELVPGERMVMRTCEGAFPMETTYTLQPLEDDRTRLCLRNAGEPSGFSRMASPLMTAAMRRANGKDLAKLKRVLEGSPEPEDAAGDTDEDGA